MKTLFIFLMSFVLSSTSLAVGSSWKYTSFPYIAKGSKFKKNELPLLQVGKRKLYPLMSPGSGTHRYWRVEQVYLSKDIKKKLFVKYNVSLNSQAVLGGWLKLKKSNVLHLKTQNGIVAYMAQGFNNVELFELQKQLSETTRKTAEVIWSPFMNCAHAEVTSNPAGDGIGYTEEQWTPSEESSDSSMLARAAGVAKCVGGETLGKVVDAGKAAWENATLENAWEAIPSQEEVKQGAMAAWDAIPTWQETKDAASSAIETISDPEAIWDGVGKAYDYTTQLIVGVYQKVKEVVAGFANLTADVADYLICQITSYLIQEGSMNAAMSVLTGGGAIGLAMAKLTASILRFAERLGPLMPAMRGLSKASLTSEERVEKASKIMSGELSPEELARLERSADGRNPAQTVSAASAGQDIASQIAGIRGMSESEKALMLRASGALNDTDRVSAAASALGRELDANQRSALLRAHEVAPGRNYDTYTSQDLLEKTRILREAGFSPQEADLLMRRGLAGQGGYVSGSLSFKASESWNSGTPGSTLSASYFNGGSVDYKLMKIENPRDFAVARDHFTQEGDRWARANRPEAARVDYLRAGNSEKYADTYLRPIQGGGYRLRDVDEARRAVQTLQREINGIELPSGRVNVPVRTREDFFNSNEARYSRAYYDHFVKVRKEAIENLNSWIQAAED